MISNGDELLRGKYTVVGKLGEGSYGTVYLVRERHTNRELALKRIVDPSARDSFLSEMKHLSTLEGKPHILPILTAEEDDQGVLMIVCPYMNAGSLSAYLEIKGRLSEPEAVDITRQISGALAYGHEQGILHKDVKPENILGKRDPQGQITWYLGDWGIAEMKRGSLTAPSLGTFEYTPPEVWEGKRYPQSDVYSLGCTLYYLLTGSPPFSGSSPELMRKHTSQEPDLSLISSPCVREVLSMMLAKEPQDRAGAADLPDLLDSLLLQLGTGKGTLRIADLGAFRKAVPRVSNAGQKRSVLLEQARNRLEKGDLKGTREHLNELGRHLGDSARADAEYVSLVGEFNQVLRKRREDRLIEKAEDALNREDMEAAREALDDLEALLGETAPSHTAYRLLKRELDRIAKESVGTMGGQTEATRNFEENAECNKIDAPKRISEKWNRNALDRVDAWLRQEINRLPLHSSLGIGDKAKKSREIGEILPKGNIQGFRYLLRQLCNEGYVRFEDNRHFVVVRRIP